MVIIFQNSADSGLVLIDWRLAYRAYLFKEGGDIQVIRKMVESKLRDVIAEYLKKNKSGHRINVDS